MGLIKKIILLLTISLLGNYLGLAQDVDSSKVFESVIIKTSNLRVEKTAITSLTITKKELAFSNPQTSAHLLENTGAVLVQRSQGGGGSPVIRGFEANKVLLVVDGIRMNNAIYRGGHLQNVVTLDPNIIQQIDVLFGANSLRFGSDALGGVMHFQTIRPDIKNDGKSHINIGALARVSSANREKTYLLSTQFAYKRWATLFQTSSSDFGDLRTGKKYDEKYGNWGKRTFYVARFDDRDSMVKNENTHVQVGTGYRQNDGSAKLLFAQNQYTSHMINFQLSSSSNIPRYDRLSELNSKNLPVQAEWYYGPQERRLIAYHFDQIKSTKLYEKLQIIAAFQDIEESRYTRAFKSDRRTQRIEKVKVGSINADAKKTINKSTLFYGIEGQYNDVNSTAAAYNLRTKVTTAASTRYPDGGATMWNIAAYVMESYTLNEKANLVFGARYNRTELNATFIDKTFYPLPYNNLTQKHNALVGNATWEQKITPKLSSAIAISNAYRAPNVDDIAKIFESMAGRLIIPNSNLKSEKTYNIEWNLTQRFNNGGLIKLLPYFTRYFNALTLQASLFEGKDTVTYDNVKSAVFTTANIASANVYGVTLQTKYQPVSGIQIEGFYTYTRGRVIDNDNNTKNTPLDHIPPVFGKIALNYQKNKYQASVYTLFNGAKKAEDYRLKTEDNEIYSADPILGYMPAWATFNLRFGYEMYPNTFINLSIENLLDTHYRVFASGVSAPGRNFSVTIRGGF